MAAKPKVYKSFHDDDKENYNGARKTENRKKKHSTKCHKTLPKNHEKYLSIKVHLKHLNIRRN